MCCRVVGTRRQRHRRPNSAVAFFEIELMLAFPLLFSLQQPSKQMSKRLLARRGRKWVQRHSTLVWQVCVYTLRNNRQERLDPWLDPCRRPEGDARWEAISALGTMTEHMAGWVGGLREARRGKEERFFWRLRRTPVTFLTATLQLDLVLV